MSRMLLHAAAVTLGITAALGSAGVANAVADDRGTISGIMAFDPIWDTLPGGTPPVTDDPIWD
ncbi:hypothetical protein AB0O01_25220 [Streptomyces sp. NPDC093252]|uniref:hypothetical protein n=1 Tax=Streptomyces sp. NPDC093252 TaxID=3154980 RepID=UPI0034192332